MWTKNVTSRTIFVAFAIIGKYDNDDGGSSCDDDDDDDDNGNSCDYDDDDDDDDDNYDDCDMMNNDVVDNDNADNHDNDDDYNNYHDDLNDDEIDKFNCGQQWAALAPHLSSSLAERPGNNKSRRQQETCSNDMEISFGMETEIDPDILQEDLQRLTHAEKSSTV
ncbi:hypothetical protein DPMN_134150 [Dreissena polymorpha]|uniref:Uncharacterized protein n=1 Tax=Dreissena polymorpha TaxID=45954 RepID=A0A9D4FZ86_DREPO|nr:hypothetical protein DPMN_134150 [Dreissena polymorpha]